MKVNRSSSKRAYKKRRTVRKSRVNRRRKTQRGGFNFAEMRAKAEAEAKKLAEAGKGTIASGAFSVVMVNSLVNLGKVMSSLMIMLHIAKTYSSNPIEAKRLIDAKADQLIKDNPNATECVSKLKNAIDLKIKQNIVSKIPSSSSDTAVALSASIDKMPSLLEMIVVKQTEILGAPDKALFIKGIIDAKITELKSSIQAIRTQNPDLANCFDKMKQQIETEVKTKMEDLKAKIDTVIKNNPNAVNGLMEAIEQAKSLADKGKQGVSMAAGVASTKFSFGFGN
jgi:hypothetical protein